MGRVTYFCTEIRSSDTRPNTVFLCLSFLFQLQFFIQLTHMPGQGNCRREPAGGDTKWRHRTGERKFIPARPVHLQSTEPRWQNHAHRATGKTRRDKNTISPLWSLFARSLSVHSLLFLKKITKSQTVTQYRHVAAGPERGQRRRFE